MSQKVMNTSHERSCHYEGKDNVTEGAGSCGTHICSGMIGMFTVGMLEKINHTRTLHTIIKISFPFIVIAMLILFFWSSKYKKQPSDELSSALSLRATAAAVKIELCTAAVVGVFMHMHGNHRHFEYYSITGIDVCMFAFFLSGIFFAAKNIAFLWLDRTPKAEEDE